MTSISQLFECLSFFPARARHILTCIVSSSLFDRATSLSAMMMVLCESDGGSKKRYLSSLEEGSWGSQPRNKARGGPRLPL